MNCFIDIETVNEIPDTWNSNPTPLPIACIGVKIDDRPVLVYHNTVKDGAAMTDEQVVHVIDKLIEYDSLNCKIVSFNGSGFDIKLLAQYVKKDKNEYMKVRKMNLNHIDLMFLVVCNRGHPVALAKITDAMGIGKKSLEGGGLESVKLWAAGKYEDVYNYNTKDVELLYDLFREVNKTQNIQFVSKAGNRIKFPVEVLTVKDAYNLPPLEKALMSRDRFMW